VAVRRERNLARMEPGPTESEIESSGDDGARVRLRE